MDLAPIRTPGCSWLLIKHHQQVSMRTPGLEKRFWGRRAFLKCGSKQDSVKLQVWKEIMLQNEKLIFMLKDAETADYSYQKKGNHTHTRQWVNFPPIGYTKKLFEHELWRKGPFISACHNPAADNTLVIHTKEQLKSQTNTILISRMAKINVQESMDNHNRLYCNFQTSKWTSRYCLYLKRTKLARNRIL